MIILDLETTGLLKPEANSLKEQPYITEIYAVKLDWISDEKQFKFINELETFVRPPIPISEEITNITGITDAMLLNAPTFPAMYDSLCNFFLGEDTLVAHNAAFDTGVLLCELSRMDKQHKFPWPQKQLCTVELSMPLEHKKLSLAKLHTYFFGAPHEDAHRAKNDVMALTSCLRELIIRGLV